MKLTPADKLYPVTPTVHGWAAFQTEWKVHFNSYALQTSDGLVLIDPTHPSTAVLRRLEVFGTPAAVILTNAHHDRAADWFRKAYEVQIYASENAAADCDTKIDVPVMDGEKLPGGLRAIFLPGVSPSEMALLGNGVLHLGDALLHTPGKGLELMPDQFISDKKQYRASLQKLLPLEFEVVTFGHGEPLLQAGHAMIAKFLKPRR